MNTRIDYCGVIMLLRGLMEQGLFTRNEAERSPAELRRKPGQT